MNQAGCIHDLPLGFLDGTVFESDLGGQQADQRQGRGEVFGAVEQIGRRLQVSALGCDSGAKCGWRWLIGERLVGFGQLCLDGVEVP